MTASARLALAALVGCTVSMPASAQDTVPLLAGVFQDHAVLQRDRPITIFGKASPGESVSVSIGASAGQATADTSGAWTATLPPLPAGGPHTLVAKTPGGRAQTVSDVLMGDVWLCSGQSNMEWPVSLSTGGGGAIASSASETIRLLQVPHASTAAPRAAFDPPAAWQSAGPESVGPFSAVCYYFARELQKTVHAPMGLVHASWGGSNIETWFSAPGLRAVGGFDDRLDLLALYAKDPKAATVRLGHAWEAWWRSRVPAPAGGEPWQPGAPGAWNEAPAALGDWKAWGVPELASFDGMVWFRRTVRLTGAQASAAHSVSLGGIDEVDQTWVNGQAIGNTFGWGTERTYTIPAGLLHDGDNTIVVNVLSTWASGGMLGPAEKMAVHLSDGTTVPIAGGWQYQRVPPETGPPPRAPWESVGGLTTLGNAMIAPLGRIGLRGVLWYQGESNASAADAYQALLAGLMADSRRTFGAGLPFLVVQLPNFGAPVTSPGASDWANLREAQRRAVAADAHSALTVTIDLGEAGELHPPNKAPVGARLARAARHVVYGEAITPSGPRPLRVERTGGGIVITFADVEGALVAYSGAQPNAFDVCGADQASCRFASAAIDGARVVVTPPDTNAVARVRYCWGAAPVCTLHDGSGLPAGPFEIDVP